MAYSTSFSSLNLAKQALQEGAFDKALKLYLKHAENFPELAKFYAFNIAFTRKRAQQHYATFNATQEIRRAAIFATYSSKRKIEPHVIHYLSYLRKVADCIIVVGDFSADSAEISKLDGLADHKIFERHGEYDFGSYKRGYFHLASQGTLDQIDELILCNDSCYGPLQGFEWMFHEMKERNVDFWGITQNSDFGDHVQSYFVALNQKTLSSPAFLKFISAVERQESVHEVIQKYELGLTRTLTKAGFVWDTFINSQLPGLSQRLSLNPNPTLFPNFLLETGAQLVKVKAVRDTACNAELPHKTLNFLAQENMGLLQLIYTHLAPNPSFSLDKPLFSVILPVFNREKYVARAIDSLLIQNYNNYELIVVDDGSTDETLNIVKNRYQSLLDNSCLRLIHYPKNAGVAEARNKGLAAAQGDWIAYLDSDNTVEKNFLQVFAQRIQENPTLDCCYAMMHRSVKNQVFGFEFDYQKLLSESYIDLGVVAHRKALINETGNFDTSLRRLVDWDFLIRIMRNRQVDYIPEVVMHYWDDAAATDRISVKESYDLALCHIRKKNNLPFLVSTVVVPNGNIDDLINAINYACTTKLTHHHEVIVFENSGCDATWVAIEKIADRYSSLKAARQGSHVSIQKNFLDATGAARGDFVRILCAGRLPTGKDRLQELVDHLIHTPELPQTIDNSQIQFTEKKSLLSENFGDFEGVIYRRHVLEKILR